MGAISTATRACLTFCHILLLVPFHLVENFLGRFAETLGRHFLGIVAYDNHRPYGLLDIRDNTIKQRTQKPTALVTIHRIAVLFLRKKTKTTKTVRSFNPSHAKSGCADELSLDGYLPISGLVRQPIRTQSGYKPTPTYFL